MIDGVPASVTDQRSGQSLPAGAGMSPDLLVAGSRVARGNHAQLGYQLVTQERAEPRPVAGFGETAPGVVPGVGECVAGRAAVLGLAQSLQPRRLPPVAVPGQWPAGGGPVRMRRLAERLGGQDGVTLDVQSSCGVVGEVGT